MLAFTQAFKSSKMVAEATNHPTKERDRSAEEEALEEEGGLAEGREEEVVGCA